MHKINEVTNASEANEGCLSWGGGQKITMTTFAQKKTRAIKRQSRKKLPSQDRTSIEPFLKLQVPENVTFVESNGFRQGNLVKDPHFGLEPHKRVSQARDACCARVRNYKYMVVGAFQKIKTVHRGGRFSTRKKERIAIHKIARVKRRWIFPGLNVLTGGYSKKGGGFHKKKSKISYTQK